jgi:hypothetical protein
MSLETRSNSALMKRAEQLKRWQDSETFREPGEPKRKTRKVNFANSFEHFSASRNPPPSPPFCRSTSNNIAFRAFLGFFLFINAS